MYYIKDTDLPVIPNDNFTKNLNRRFIYLFTFRQLYFMPLPFFLVSIIVFIHHSLIADVLRSSLVQIRPAISVHEGDASAQTWVLVGDHVHRRFVLIVVSTIQIPICFKVTFFLIPYKRRYMESIYRYYGRVIYFNLILHSIISRLEGNISKFTLNFKHKQAAIKEPTHFRSCFGISMQKWQVPKNFAVHLIGNSIFRGTNIRKSALDI